ncbi:hypothetical protein B0O80DRAFT_446804 [Mortierella sp. GBAus27b]|nr:hypothetical protein BGX31_004032 [Mortierella sp. GBA43]KAI8357221.1 hypothetical protein B0O80DRAFT_446804 [Mortierella sp. GBAus27b]
MSTSTDPPTGPPTMTNFPLEPTREHVVGFLDNLLDMNASAVRRLDILLYPKWARRVLNDERCRRRRDGAQSQPTAEEKDQTIALVLKQYSATSVKDEANKEDDDENEDDDQEDDEDDQDGEEDEEDGEEDEDEEDNEEEEASPDGEGEYLHDQLAQGALAYEIPFDLHYDRDLGDDGDGEYDHPSKGRRRRIRYGERSMFGSFTCRSCTLKNHGHAHLWYSGMISTQLWLSLDDKRYRIVINFQKCRRCESYVKPKLDEEKFVNKVIRAFTLWLGLREAEDGWQDDQRLTQPHDQERCRGCEKGVCKRKWSNEDN